MKPPNAPKRKPIFARLSPGRLLFLALLLAMGSPFGLYWALQNGLTGLASACFGLILLSLGLTPLVGLNDSP